MKRDPAQNPIRVGVVGYGGAFNMGKQHLEQMRAAGMSPTAVCEVDPKRLEVAQKDFPGIETYGSIDEMLQRSGVELVVVITPHNTHAELGLKILQAGRHCVLEKPMAITTEECTRLIEAARRRKRVVSTYHNRHWDGWILRAMEQIRDKKVIGEVVRVDLRFGGYSKPGTWWRSSRTISGGILYDWGVHLLEYALQLTASDLVEVSGYAWEGFWASQPGAAFPKDSNEDEAQALVRLKSGARINLTITALDPCAIDRGFVEVVGTNGSYAINWGGYTLTQVAPDGTRTVTTGRHHDSQNQKYYENIAAHLYRGEKLVITGEWSRRPIHVLDLAMKSARLGRALPVKFK